jgi:hypothetical protein
MYVCMYVCEYEKIFLTSKFSSPILLFFPKKLKLELHICRWGEITNNKPLGPIIMIELVRNTEQQVSSDHIYYTLLSLSLSRRY